MKKHREPPRDRCRRVRRGRYSLVFSDSGFFGICDNLYDEIRLISRTEEDALVELERLQEPEEKEYALQRSKELEALINEGEDEKTPKVPKPRAIAKVNKRGYRSVKDRLLDPAIAAALADVTVYKGYYFKDGKRCQLIAQLEKLTGSHRIAASVISAAWSAGILKGERRIGPSGKKKQAPLTNLERGACTT